MYLLYILITLDLTTKTSLSQIFSNNVLKALFLRFALTFHLHPVPFPTKLSNYNFIKVIFFSELYFAVPVSVKVRSSVRKGGKKASNVVIF